MPNPLKVMVMIDDGERTATFEFPNVVDAVEIETNYSNDYVDSMSFTIRPLKNQENGTLYTMSIMENDDLDSNRLIIPDPS